MAFRPTRAAGSGRRVHGIGSIGACAALLLAGCAAVPRDRPQVAALVAANVGLGPAAEVPLAGEWWHALGDVQLDRIMADALAGNPSLDAAMARLRSAEQSIAVQRAGLLPQVTGDVEETYQRFSENYIIPPPYGGSTKFLGTAQANLDWSLDLAGRQKALIDQARGRAEAATLDLAASRVTLTGAVAQAYVDLARAERQSDLAGRFVSSRQQALGLARTRKRAGLASDFELRSSETLLAEARQAQVRADGASVLMVHALAALAGRGADYYVGIARPTIDLDRALPVPASLPADLLGRRADILAARARVEVADAGRRVARADFLPNVDLKAFFGFQAIGLSSLLTGGAFTYGVGPAIHLPIFAGGRLSAQYRSALAGIDEAVADYNDNVVRAVKEAADAISAVRTNAADAEQQRAVVSGLRQTVHLDEVRVRTGLGAQLDVLDSGDRLLEADQRQADIAADGAIRRVQLLVAIGGSFDPASYSHTAAALPVAEPGARTP